MNQAFYPSTRRSRHRTIQILRIHPPLTSPKCATFASAHFAIPCYLGQTDFSSARRVCYVYEGCGHVYPMVRFWFPSSVTPPVSELALTYAVHYLAGSAGVKAAPPPFDVRLNASVASPLPVPTQITCDNPRCKFSPMHPKNCHGASCKQTCKQL